MINPLAEIWRLCSKLGGIIQSFAECLQATITQLCCRQCCNRRSKEWSLLFMITDLSPFHTHSRKEREWSEHIDASKPMTRSNIRGSSGKTISQIMKKTRPWWQYTCPANSHAGHHCTWRPVRIDRNWVRTMIFQYIKFSIAYG